MEEGRGARAAGVGGGDGGAAIAGGGKLAGAGEMGPTGHQINLRGHRADAGEMASPKERIARAGKGSHGTRHGRPRRSSLAHLAKAL
jgi:hypothetical protein